MGKGRSYINSKADCFMRGKVVNEVGDLLDQLVKDEIILLKLITKEFNFTYGTISNLRHKQTTITFETIRKLCFPLGHYLSREIEAVEGFKKHVQDRDMWLKRLYELKETYLKIYGMQATVVLNLIHQGKDLREFVE